MTENKRFIPVYKCVTQDNEVYVVCKGEHDADVVATTLNEFYERNEYLEKENKELKKRLSDLQKKNYGNIDGIAFYQEENASLYEKISDLECENEKLKQENKKLQRQMDTQKLINKSLKINEESNKKAIQKLTVQKLEIRKWVNDKISYLEKKYEFGQTEYKGCPMHNIQFGINILKELREYWWGQEND